MTGVSPGEGPAADERRETVDAATEAMPEGDDPGDGSTGERCPTDGGATDGGASGGAVPSKSRRKRDADAVRELGRRLAELGVAERAAIPLDDDVRAAIDELNAIRKHGARKRQLGFLAKRLRRSDLAPVEAALERLARSARASAARHHTLERWRDRLLGAVPDESPPQALTAYLDEHPQADRQRLRQLQRRALDERAAGRAPGAARELFRLLRDAPEAAEADPIASHRTRPRR